MGSPKQHSIDDTQNEGKLTGHLLIAILAAVLGSALPNGFNIAVVNNPQQIISEFVNSSYYERYDEYIPSSTLLMIWSVAVAMVSVGAMIGSFGGGYLANRYGRKFTLLTNNIPMALGAALAWASKVAGSYEMIILARFILGITAGVSTAVTPMYLMEISTVRLRGMIGTIHQLTVVTGILVAMVLGLNSVLGTDDLWHILLALTGVPVIYQLVTLTWCPESPAHLLVNKRDDIAAEKALMWLRQTRDVKAELSELHRQREKQDYKEEFSFLDLFRKRNYRKPFVISIMMHISMPASGINAVLYYSTSIFQSARLSHKDAQWATLGIGGVLVFMTFISAMTIDRAGRRILHLTGLAGMCLGTIVLTIGITLQDEANWLSFMAIGAVFFFIVSFGTGPGSVPWLVSTELFTEEARFAAVSISVTINWLTHAAVAFVFPTFIESFGSYMFIPFTVILVLFWLFTFFMLPETKGRTFQEISRNFEKQKTPPEQSLKKIETVSTSL